MSRKLNLTVCVLILILILLSKVRSDTGSGPFILEFTGAAKTYGDGKTVLEQIEIEDQFSEERKSNLYYPFACLREWELARWIMRQQVSMADIDQFLRLEIVSLSHLRGFSVLRHSRYNI